MTHIAGEKREKDDVVAKYEKTRALQVICVRKIHLLKDILKRSSQYNRCAREHLTTLLEEDSTHLSLVLVSF